ncbi:MAG: hypothetical protein KDC68_07130 [Gelidibacter sp.]|nr:hypothetical protein [Gelidibacter sp.]
MIITPTLVILLLLTFSLVFLFVKTIDKRKWLTFLLSLILTPITYFYIIYPLINIGSSYHHQKYFNSEAWTEAPQLRYEMSDNIMSSDTLIGATKNDVKQLLGTYEWLSWNDSIKDHDANKWNYALGLKPGALNEQKECMELIFKNDKVIKINTYQEKITFDAKKQTK